MLAKTFEHLVNGGAAVAGVDGLEAAIRGIEAENAESRRELSMIPTQRAEAILKDNHDAEIDRLEARENTLYRAIEKGDLQISELYIKLAEHRNIGSRSRLDKHRSAVAEAVTNLETAITAAVQANSEMIAALEHAKRDLGSDTANRFLPAAHFVGLLNEQCLGMWRGNLQNQNQRIAREQNRAR